MVLTKPEKIIIKKHLTHSNTTNMNRRNILDNKLCINFNVSHNIATQHEDRKNQNN